MLALARCPWEQRHFLRDDAAQRSRSLKAEAGALRVTYRISAMSGSRANALGACPKVSAEAPAVLPTRLRSAPQMREYAEIVARISRDAPGVILDWGCGFGQVTSVLISVGLRIEAFEYYGPGSPTRLCPCRSIPRSTRT